MQNDIIVNNFKYTSGTRFTWKDAYASCIGILKYGIWEQDGSGGEYPGTPCYGWYVEVTGISPLEHTGDTKEEAEENYPAYLKTQSVLELEKNPTFHIIAH